MKTGRSPSSSASFFNLATSAAFSSGVIKCSGFLIGKGWLMRWLVSITFTGFFKALCKCVDGGFPDVEPILNGLLTELAGVEGG